jgi:hypothetical protein
MDGTLLTSPDGVAWTPRDGAGTLSMYSVAWTGKKLIAMCYATDVIQPNVMLISPDGIAWTKSSSGSVQYPMISIASTGSRSVAVGYKSIIRTQPEAGGEWSVTTLNLDVTLNRVLWTGKHAVVVGEVGTIASSLDADKWSVVHKGAFFDRLMGVASNGKVLVAVGEPGQILASAEDEIPVAIPAMRAPPGLSLGQTRSDLTISLPESWRGRKARATVFAVDGMRTLEAREAGPEGGIRLPIRNMPRGRYVVRITVADGETLMLPFAVIR